MVHTQNPKTHGNPPVSLIKPVFIGAGIGLILISFFVFGVEGRAEWGNLWRIRPLIITPFAGATGGAFYYFIDQLRYRNGVNPTIALIISILVFIVGLWMGIVLGLNGTMWN
ncbi:MAG: hypothetical protein ACO1NS_13465 [Daejeonella sp.]